MKSVVIRLNECRVDVLSYTLRLCICIHLLDLRWSNFVLSEAVQLASLQGSASELELGT
jgi:hypothetical protein